MQEKNKKEREKEVSWIFHIKLDTQRPPMKRAVTTCSKINISSTGLQLHTGCFSGCQRCSQPAARCYQPQQ